ncbi:MULTISPECIES: carbohydrate ABC transporter permease [unclassified Acidisoma]|uniref:carbohydrate ABC transporter permease n=1 Tax=unclassified Acidisoma TaxID=2634065 RepID=UPI001C20296B|nr:MULTISPECIES: sugar ABC transporter permease [unclassified Acidisoma]
MKAAGSRAIGKGAGVGRTDASTGRLRGRAREAFRQCFSFRWVAAAVIVLVWFVYFPVVDNFIISTTRSDIYTGDVSYVGLGNYSRLLHDKVVWSALWNNCAYAVISVIFQVFGAFILAGIIESLRSDFWRRFWRALYFVPSAISLTVTGLLFYFIYQPQIGILDAVMRATGLGALIQPWLGSEHTAIYAIIAMSQWQGFGYSTLLFAVAIQKIPGEIFDAARIDGIGPIRRIISITWPLTREMTGLMILVTITGAFQVFNEVMVMTGGGPNNASQVLGTWVYQQGFIQDDFGYGAAIASVVFVATMLTGAAHLWYTKRGRVSW